MSLSLKTFHLFPCKRGNQIGDFFMCTANEAKSQQQKNLAE